MWQPKKSSPYEYLKEQRKDVVSFFYLPKGAAKESEWVFIWDLDKTYLDTQFESLSSLVKTYLEKSAQKRNVPGTSTLVKSLQEKNRSLPVFFISASPPQMHNKIFEKLRMDGIQPFGFFAKDNLKNLYPSSWKKLTNHVGFKIQALMEIRLLVSENSKMICWGDDSESDALIYSLFSDICAHRLTDKETLQLLSSFKVSQDQIKLILELRDQREGFDPVERVYINLAVDTDPEYYRRFGRRLMAVDNCFEIALDLFQRGHIDKDSLFKVALDLLENYQFKPFKLERSYRLLCERKRVCDLAHQELLEDLKSIGVVTKDTEITKDLVHADKLPVEKDFEGLVRPWIPERINYLSDY